MRTLKDSINGGSVKTAALAASIAAVEDCPYSSCQLLNDMFATLSATEKAILLHLAWGFYNGVIRPLRRDHLIDMIERPDAYEIAFRKSRAREALSILDMIHKMKPQTAKAIGDFCALHVDAAFEDEEEEQP